VAAAVWEMETPWGKAAASRGDGEQWPSALGGAKSMVAGHRCPRCYVKERQVSKRDRRHDWNASVDLQRRGREVSRNWS